MKKLLLVEDDQYNMDILVSCLSRAGYAFDMATDGKIALNKLSQSSDYAIVITDRMMPNMDGMELHATMKANPAWKNIPVIMQTAASNPEDVTAGINSGVYYYLTKPYKENALLALVRSAIREQTQHELFDRRLKNSMAAMVAFEKGDFAIARPEEAQNIALFLGALFPRPELAVSGLYELLMNAIEHGNLEIGYEEKDRLLSASTYEEEVYRRLKLPENQHKKVTIQFARADNHCHVTITDCGKGFDYQPFMQIEPARATRNNGRGIAKANLLSFDKLVYKGNGNQVCVSTAIA